MLACLKNLGHLTCSSDTLIVELIEIMRKKKSVGLSLRTFIDEKNLDGNLCNTSPSIHHNFCGL